MFSSHFRKLLNFHSGSSQSRWRDQKRRKLKQLTLESLEDRRLLSFTTPISYPAGSSPAGVDVGDFNSDGRDDIAVANNSLVGSVNILLANADGSFLPAATFPAGANSFDVNTGDFNNDGKADLAVIGSALEILLGNGDGTFADPLSFPSAVSAHSVNVGDFNNDGNLDVGTTNNNSASLFLGNGDGTFQGRVDIPVAGNNINLVVDDFDRDGNLDMATSNSSSVGTVSVLRGHGDGSFDAPSSYYAFSAPVYLDSGDFNEDGYPDFAVPNSYVATSMSIILNNGDGTFSPPHTYGIGQTGYEIEVADFNNDGHDDYAVRGGSKYMVSHGKGDGTFYPSIEYATPSGRFEAGTHGDFNGDGAVDLAYPSSSGITVVSNDNADYQNLAGAVTFVVSAPATTTSGSVLPMTITVVDANGDVVPDFRGTVYISSSDAAASTADGYAFNPLDAGIPYAFTATDAGTHTFTGAIRLVTGGPQTVTVSAPNMTAASTSVLVTGQVTHLQVSAPVAADAGQAFAVTVSAIDSVGAVASGYSSTIRFTSTDVQAGLPANYTFTPEDAGVHTFIVTLRTSGAQSVRGVELGGTIGGGTSVNVAPQAAVSLSLAGAAGPIGVSRPYTIVARDQFGNHATSYSGTVGLTSSDAAAIFPGEVTLSGGIATANVTFLTVGSQSLTATDTVNSTITGTVTSDATPPVPAILALEGLAAATAGVSTTITMTVRDTIGQIAVGYTGTVFFSSSDIKAGLPASYTFTAADAGVHTFPVTLKTAGDQSITARDLAGGISGTAVGIQVSASTFASYALTVPNGADSKGHILVTAGETISLTVRAVDSFGNTITDYRGKAQFSSTDANAQIPRDYSFATSDLGVHTFQVALTTSTPADVVWSFSVVDSSDPNTSVTITNFEVMNAAAARFVLDVPSKATAGVAFQFRISVLDAFGNRVKNYFGTVQLGSSVAAQGLPSTYTFTADDAGDHRFDIVMTDTGDQTL
ncbi:MAG: VCBS repeat-containing protein, partial [Planctomycetales bacterium]|nr:VCBS repeat-containing protein [Planctomycetales bacterium]